MMVWWHSKTETKILFIKKESLFEQIPWDDFTREKMHKKNDSNSLNSQTLLEP